MLFRRRSHHAVDRIRLLMLVPLAIALAGAPDPAPAQSPEVTWAKPIEVASGGAFQGPWAMNASRFLFVDDPTVAIDEAGTVAVSWVDQSRKDVYFQLYDVDGEGQLDEPVNVSRTPEIFSWLPRMIVTSGEPRAVYVLWQEIIFSGGSHGGEILFARSRDGGRTFDGPSNLSNSVAGDGKGRLTRRYWDNGSLDLAMGPDGTLHAAWTEYDGVLWYSRSSDGGDTFSAPLPITGEIRHGPARGPSLAVDAGKGIYLAWTVGEDPNADIRIAMSNDNGRSFGAPRVVFKSEGHSDAPKIVVGPTGNLHLVYAESPAGPFARYHIRYARSTDGGRSFETPRAISGASNAAYESSHFPALSADGDGNLYLLWELFPSRQRRSRGLGFTISSDAGQSFAPPAVVPGSADAELGDNGSRQGLLMRKLAVNAAGAIAIVNSTFKRDQASRIWLYRGR